jgi:hypothetical protein
VLPSLPAAATDSTPSLYAVWKALFSVVLEVLPPRLMFTTSFLPLPVAALLHRFRAVTRLDEYVQRQSLPLKAFSMCRWIEPPPATPIDTDRVVQRGDRAGDVRAVTAGVLVPVAGAAVVGAGDVGRRTGQVLVGPLVPRIDDADHDARLAGRRERRVVRLHHA